MATLPICLAMVIFLIAMVETQARFIALNTSNIPLVTDGVSHVVQKQPLQNHHVNNSDSYLSATGTCAHEYGFFPCADNTAGYLLQIVIYQYLMMVGGGLLAQGSKTLFTMLGTGVFGASLFRILLNFPRIIFVVVSGFYSTQEEAQRQVSLSIGIYAGSTVFALTLVWGVVAIVGRREIPEIQTSCSTQEPNASTPLLDKEIKDICTELTETGITTDEKTSYTAGIMLLSLIPFGIAELVNIFNVSSSASRVVILIALFVSATSLLSYFLYQLWDPWMQERSLEYSKYQNLVSGFLKYVQRQTKGKLVDANGKPNIPAIEGLFSQHDKDADKSLTREELEKFMGKIQTGEVEIDKDYAISEVLNVFDLNSDGRISEDEFIKGSEKWIDEAKKLEEHGESTTKQSVNEIIQPFTKKRRDELDEIENLMGNIVKSVRSQALEAKWLMKDDGNLDLEHIQTLFNQFGSINGDNSISQSELKQLIETVKFGDGKANPESDEAVVRIMRGFDTDGNNTIDEKEFVNEAKKWVRETVPVEDVEEEKQSTIATDKGNWEEFDKLVRKVRDNESLKEKLLVAWTYTLPILRILLGVTMLTLLAKPFMVNVIYFTTSIGMEVSFISFIIIPIIMNAGDLISAMFPASQKCSRTASLTYSEIYGDVFMNNILGLTTILAILYFKDLPWDYSAEVIIIVIVCGVVGFFAYFSNTYPLWTSLFAFFLYIFAFATFYILHYGLGWN